MKKKNEYVQIIEDIENELHPKYLTQAINYIDNNYDNAWSNALNRFDLALSKSISSNNRKLALLEGEIYRDTILRLINVFIRDTRSKEMDDLLSSS